MGLTKAERFKKILLTKKQDILETCNNLENEATMNDDDGTPDLLDQALAAYAQEFAHNLSETERKTLELVDEALERIAADEFGLCVHCSKKVQANRLKAVPWARHCLECQDMQDRGLLPEN